METLQPIAYNNNTSNHRMCCAAVSYFNSLPESAELARCTFKPALLHIVGC